MTSKSVIVAGLCVAMLVGASGVYLAVYLTDARPRESSPVAEALPRLGTVPEFHFTSQANRPFGSGDLRGKVWVANFIFTRCPSICPLLTQKMGNLRAQTEDLGNRLALVSFTVDPEYDLPAVLKAYAENHQASDRWTFLTGNRADLYAAVVGGMKVQMTKEPTNDLMALAHGGHFVLVDAQMHIRGYYSSEDPDAMRQLKEDARNLASDPRSKS